MPSSPAQGAIGMIPGCCGTDQPPWPFTWKVTGSTAAQAAAWWAALLGPCNPSLLWSSSHSYMEAAMTVGTVTDPAWLAVSLRADKACLLLLHPFAIVGHGTQMWSGNFHPETIKAIALHKRAVLLHLPSVWTVSTAGEHPPVLMCRCVFNSVSLAFLV